MKNICCTGCNSEKIHKISSILHVIFEQKKYNENRNYYTELWKKRIRLNSKYNILLIQNKYYHYRSNIFWFIFLYIFCCFVLPIFTRIPFAVYPCNYRVILKKNTSIFVKLHLAYKKMTRKKFVNIRYVSYRAREEMNKLGMK